MFYCKAFIAIPHFACGGWNFCFLFWGSSSSVTLFTFFLKKNQNDLRQLMSHGFNKAKTSKYGCMLQEFIHVFWIFWPLCPVCSGKVKYALGHFLNPSLPPSTSIFIFIFWTLAFHIISVKMEFRIKFR